MKRVIKLRKKLPASKRGTFLSALLLLGAVNLALAGVEDDPLLGKVMIDQLEVRDADENNPVVLAAQGWLGKDLQKLWFKTDVERSTVRRLRRIGMFKLECGRIFNRPRVELGLLLASRVSLPIFLKLIQHYLSERVGALRYD